jgi:hypothetical protein
LLEKGLLTAATLIACCLAIAALYNIVRPDRPRESAGAFEQQGSLSSEVAGAEQSPDPGAAPRPREAQPRTKRAPTPPHADRTDCDALRGVHDRTKTERQWFLDNCMFLSRKARQANGTAGARSGGERAGSESSAGLPITQKVMDDPPAWLSNDRAIELTVEWIELSQPIAYYTNPDGCTAVWLNGHYAVTCYAAPMGCAGPLCEGVIAACVFASRPIVVPDARC